MPLPLIGIGMGLVGAVGKMLGRGKANRKMSELLKSDPEYTANPLAAQRLGLAKTLLNARMPGAIQAERNILTNQANKIDNVNKVATDSAQAITAAAGIGGQTDNAFEDLALTEAQDYQRRYQNQDSAMEGVINEQDKVFNDQTRRFGNKVQVSGAQNQNRQDNWQDFSNMGFGLADFSMNGGFDNMFTGKSKPRELTGGYKGIIR